MTVRAEPEVAPRKPAAHAPLVQRRAESSDASFAAPASVHRTLSSPGRPLDPGTRSDMESRFGHDFGNVRIHNDSQAGQSARDIHAHAYTSGDHIAFAPGKYQPESCSGRELLAHELAHTVQQAGLQRRGSDLAVDTEPGSALEHEADAAARSALHGTGAPTIAGRPASPLISREPDEEPPKTLPKGAVSITTEAGKLGTLTHTVSPDGQIPPKSSSARVRKFKADPFYLPGSKGEGADKVYTEYITANQLRTIIGFNDAGQPRTELWQARDRTDVLGDSWLQLMRWPEAEKNTKWQAVTGETTPFPQVAGETAQIDHIVELQLGGTNNPSNLRALDKTPNGESGTSIWVEASMLAKAVRDEASFAVGPQDQIQLSFTGLKTVGAVWSGDHTKKPMNALKAHMKALSERGELKDDGTTKYIRLAAGANIDDFAVPADWSKAKPAATLADFPFNKAPAQLVSSLLLKKFTYISTVGIWVEAELDLRNRTRIPLGDKAAAAAAGGKAFKLQGARATVKDPFKLSMPTPPAGLSFDYPYLSPVAITKLSLNDSGDLDWTGTLTTRFAPLNPLELQFKAGELKVSKGINEAELKKKKLLGFSINEAKVSLTLAPNFNIDATLGFQMGEGEKPLVKGKLTVTPDGGGIKGTGDIALNLPKIKSATSTITYTGGGGRAEDWKVKLSIQSEDITLGAGYSLTGKVDAFIENGELKFAGEFTATLPGGNSATLGLRRSQQGNWQLKGGAKFKLPRIPTQLEIDATYDLGTEVLVANLKTATPISLLGGKLKGRLDSLKVVITKAGTIVVTGTGGVDIATDKATGSVTVTMHEGNWFSGSGSVTYLLRPNLSVAGSVEFSERPEPGKPKLRVGGALTLKRLELFPAKTWEKTFLKVATTIPIPGLSVGTSGLVINIGGALTAGFSFGAGVIEPLTIFAGFNPLDDATDLELGVDGKVSLPVKVWLVAAVSAELAAQLDAYIAKGGVAAGLKVTGTVNLGGELFAKLSAKYKDKALKATVDAGISAKLDLGFALTAYVRAYASSIIGLDAEEKIEWVLAQASFPTGLSFLVSAPFKYDSAADPSLTLPKLTDITVERPEFDFQDAVKKLLGKGKSTKSKA